MKEKKFILFDNRTKKKIQFNPHEMKNFYSYTCGPTVYNDAHIGNFRPPLISHLIGKIMNEQFKLKCINLQCITDIDEKIINKAKKENISPLVIGKKYNEAYQELSFKLKLTSFVYLQVSKELAVIQKYIQRLISVAAVIIEVDGFYFDINRIKNDYWQFVPLPKNITSDKFAVWKIKDDEYVFSEYMPGRPGWHTECASFIHFYGKNNRVDVHISGEDIKFPHNQNELAQHIALFGKPDLAKAWLHISPVTINGEKMSKSLNNIIAMKDVLKRISFAAIRLWLLSVHYQNELSYSKSIIEGWETTYKKWLAFIHQFKVLLMINNQEEKWEKIYKNTSIDNTMFNFLLDNLQSDKYIIELKKKYKKIFNTFKPINDWKVSDLEKNSNWKLNDDMFFQISSFIKSLSFLISQDINERYTISKFTISLIKNWIEHKNMKNFAKADKIRKDLVDLHLMVV